MKKKTKTNNEIIDEVYDVMPSQFHRVLDRMIEEESFLCGKNLFDNMSYGSRRVQELCNLILG